MRDRLPLWVRVLGISVFLATFGVGCGSNDPSVPASVSNDAPVIAGPHAEGKLLLTGTAVVVGEFGGIVTNGTQRVTIPPGAFSGVKVITVVSNITSPRFVELYPEGTTFDAPVTLTMSVAGTGADMPGTTIFWWDPSASTWVDMGGAYNNRTHTVSTTLTHFSTYRAGW